MSCQTPDVEHLAQMAAHISENAGSLPVVMTLDTGYWNNANAQHCEQRGIDAYIATGRLTHNQPPTPKRGRLLREADAKTRIARMLKSKKGSPIYAQRKKIVELVNGHIKEARVLPSFLLRGIKEVDPEWHLIAAGHNLLKLFGFMRSQMVLLLRATG